MTLWTFLHGNELLCPFLTFLAVVVVHYVAKVFHYTVERHEIVACSVNKFLDYPYVGQCAVENLVKTVIGNVFNRCVERASA